MRYKTTTELILISFGMLSWMTEVSELDTNMFHWLLICRPDFSGIQNLLGVGPWLIRLKSVVEERWERCSPNIFSSSSVKIIAAKTHSRNKCLSFRAIFIFHPSGLINKKFLTFSATSLNWSKMSSPMRSGMEGWEISNQIRMEDKFSVGIRMHIQPTDGKNLP